MSFWDWLFSKIKKSPPEPLVLGARLRCPHGDAPYSILWVDPGGTIDINHVPQATVEDYIALKNIQPFGQCTTGTEGGECSMHIEFKNPWENPEPQGIMVNGKEAITQKSFLMCSNASTPLVIESSGQDHVYVKHLIFQMEMDQKYGEALRAILDDPNGSLYLNKGMYEIALQFLEDQMKAGQGALSLYMLDDKDSAQSFYIRSALAHLQPAVNPQNLGSFCDGLAAVMGRYDASMREGVDGHVLNAAMMNLLRVDSGKTNELIQAGGFYRWQEENKDSLRLMAASMKEFEYAALMVSSMMASAAKQGNKERYQEKEGSGGPEGGSDTPGYVNTCFAKGTLILANDIFKKIEDIEPGDLVWSEDIKTRKKGLKRVLQVSKHYQKQLIYLNIKGDIIKTTAEHPIWIQNKAWVYASDIKYGDVLKNSSDESIVVDLVEFIYLESPVAVYNFEVEEWHTYFVSSNKILVHNKANLYEKSGWINHDTYNEIRNRFGKKGVDKFVNSMKKGLVSGKGENGIKMFSGKGVEIGGKFYQYEIKVKGGLGDWRVFGNYDSVSGHIIFDKFTTGVH